MRLLLLPRQVTGSRGDLMEFTVRVMMKVKVKVRGKDDFSGKNRVCTIA